MEKGKHGGPRLGAGRKVKLSGRIERAVVIAAVRASMSPAAFEKIIEASTRGETKALRNLGRLYYREEQKLLAKRPPTERVIPVTGDLFTIADEPLT